MTASTTHRLITALVVSMLAALLTGCGQPTSQPAAPTPNQPPPGLTEAKARAKIEEYFTLTLSRLPEQISLSRKHPTLADVFLSGSPVPCADPNTVDKVPHSYEVRYWVIGVPRGEAERYRDLTVDAWKRLGWPTERLDDMTMKTKTPDGYIIDVLVNDNGDLTVSAGSPCFPSDTVEDKQMPMDIPHPRPGGA